VWEFLSPNKNPWNNTFNDKLITLYVNGSGGDCPIVMDINTPSCGNSRFGCWVCSVVKRDKSMEALIDSGEDWMMPLMEIRDYLVKTINREEENYQAEKYRMPVRRNGTEGSGPYWPEIRKHILLQVLRAQKVAQEKDPELKLISFQELIAIQLQWNRDFIFDFTVSEIYKSVFGGDFSFDGSKNSNYSKEKELINGICKDHPDDVKLIQNLLNAQKNKVLMVKKIGLQNDIEALIDEQVSLTMMKLKTFI
jgi:DNA sulfur modification protein DndC